MNLNLSRFNEDEKKKELKMHLWRYERKSKIIVVQGIKGKVTDKLQAVYIQCDNGMLPISMTSYIP